MFLFSDLNSSSWNAFLPDELLTFLHRDLAALPEGKTVLVPEKLWVNRFTAKPAAPDGRQWEAHRDFADLQMVLQETQYCFLDEPEAFVSAGNYDAVSDCGMFVHDGGEYHRILLTPGSALLIPPRLLHLPDVTVSRLLSQPKVVAKIHRSLLRGMAAD